MGETFAEKAYREKLTRALLLLNDLETRLVLKGDAVFVQRCCKARGFDCTALATREATGKD